jgi:aminomethyltransferase
MMLAGEVYGIAPTGPSDIRRIEAGILNYGVDMTIETNPYEVGLERLVSLDKPGGFVGRDALKEIADQGVERKLAGVEIEGPRLDLNMTPWPARAGKTPLGEVTSAVYSPRLAKNIGYAMLPVGYTALGTRVTVDTADGERGATVVPMPFIDAAKTIAKG